MHTGKALFFLASSAPQLQGFSLTRFFAFSWGHLFFHGKTKGRLHISILKNHFIKKITNHIYNNLEKNVIFEYQESYPFI